jgi:putative phosphoesterase
MRFATFSDVHANLHALRAMLEDVKRQRVDQVFCLGDLVGYGAFPNEVIELIRSTGFPTVMGNYDQGVGFDLDDCGCAYRDPEERRLGDLSFAWTKERVSAENKAFLQSLLKEVRFEAEGKRVLLVHGSPRRINEYLFEDRPPESFERLAATAQADMIVFGHTHLPYVKSFGGVVFVDDGSAGKPKDGDPRAGYALVEVKAGGIEVELRRVAYDVEAAVAAIRASGLPVHYAEALERASS